MKLESQVCSLDLSKRLKELGVKQESHFFWKQYPTGESALAQHMAGDVYIVSPSYQATYHRKELFCSAFTVAEMGEMLRDYSMSLPHKSHGEWIASVDSGENGEIVDITEADARAKMLIHLIEKGLVSLEP